MIKINDKKYETSEVIKVEINGKVYKLPLVQYLPYKSIKKLTQLQDNKDIDLIIEVMSQFIPRDILEELSIVEISQIMNAWNDVNNEDGALGN